MNGMEIHDVKDTKAKQKGEKSISYASKRLINYNI